MSHEFSQSAEETPNEKKKEVILLASQQSSHAEIPQEIQEKLEKSRELRRFLIPDMTREIEWGGESCNALYYDGVSLLDELKKQRTEGKSDLSTSLSESIGLQRPSMTDAYHIECNERMIEADIDYLSSADNVEIMVFTNNKDVLAEDLLAYFRDKFVKLESKTNNVDDWQPNITEEMKPIILENLKKTNDEPPIDETFQGKGSHTMDFQFSIYPKLSHSVRFGPTSAAPQEIIFAYPFVDTEKSPFVKRIYFCHSDDGAEYSNAHCDIATLLELNVFLKERGCQPVLRLTQNPANYFDAPDKEHHSFVI